MKKAIANSAMIRQQENGALFESPFSNRSLLYSTWFKNHRLFGLSRVDVHDRSQQSKGIGLFSLE